MYFISVLSLAAGSIDYRSDWDRELKRSGVAKAGFSSQKQGQGRRRGRSWCGIRATVSYLVSGACSQLLQRRSGNAGLDETRSSIRLCSGDVVTVWRRGEAAAKWAPVVRLPSWCLQWLCCYRYLLVAAIYVVIRGLVTSGASAVGAGSSPGQ